MIHALGHPDGLLAARQGLGEISLTLDGREITQWRGSLEDQWKAALWLTNTMIAQGWTLEPGHVLIAGSLGQDAPGEAGAYVAEFGTLGRISFQIR